MRSSLPRFIALAAIACTPALAQNQLTFQVVQSQNNFTWSGTSSLGNIVGNPSTAFQLSGTQIIDIAFQSGAQPFASATLISGNTAVVPGIHGRIDNLFPFLPPLATIDITGLALSASSPAFTVGAGGAFTAQVTMTALSGTLVVNPLGGTPSTTDLTGAAGTPTTASGTLTLVGGNLQLAMPVNATFPFSDPSSGASGSVTVTGTLNASYALVAAFCAGDGTGNSCPCSNSGSAGHGCANSVNASGALLATSGFPAIGADTLALNASGMPATASGLYFQGTTQAGGGNGAPFGDGLRCAGGSVVRLGTKTASSGASSYPTGGDLAISVRGAVPAGGATRTYQCWYRNAAAFCTAETFNLTNGVRVTWIP